MTLSNFNAVSGKDSNGHDQVTVTWTAAGATSSDVVNIKRLLENGSADPSFTLQQVHASQGSFVDNSFNATQVAQKWKFKYSVANHESPFAQIGAVVVATKQHTFITIELDENEGIVSSHSEKRSV